MSCKTHSFWSIAGVCCEFMMLTFDFTTSDLWRVMFALMDLTDKSNGQKKVDFLLLMPFQALCRFVGIEFTDVYIGPYLEKSPSTTYNI